MRVLSRQAADAANIFSALSLAIANYKPVPILPTASNLSAPSGNSSVQHGGSSFANMPGGLGGTTAPNFFQVQNSPSALQLPGQGRDVQQWGQPSILYIPASGNEVENTSATSTTMSGKASELAVGKNATAQPNVLAKGNTMGPGNCPIIAEPYVPQGGWETVPPPVYPAFDPVKANIMRYRQQIGVNLGSWFVQENWMEASFFSCSTGGKAAEYDVLDGYGQSANGIANVTQKMTKHWDTFITEADFQQMAAIGINTIRLPIGYWSVGPYFTHDSPFEPYAQVYEYSWRFVARAINWAAKYDIGVVLDLHGAYGSQNGQAHSGLSDGNIEFFTPQNMNLTTELLVWLAHEVSGVTNIVGIQLLNEPQNRNSLWPWYNYTMDAMRQASTYAATVPLYFHDAFDLNTGASFVQSRPDFVVQDHHSYYVYTASDNALSAAGHVSEIHGTIADQLEAQGAIARRNLIIGEWSCALAPSSLSQSDDPTRDQIAFCGAQNTVYSNATSGWIFWSWKMHNCDDNGGWCFQQSIKDYLTAPFNAWGLPDVVASTLANWTSAQQADFSSKIVSAVNQLQLPVLPKVLQQQDDPATSSQPAPMTAATTVRPLGMADTPRIGKVVPPGTSQSALNRRTYGGSLAARAAALLQQEQESQHRLVARQNSATTLPLSADTRALLAQNSGYSDGFLSAKIFASSTSLSRLGFGLQYMQDSWNARVSQGKLSPSNRVSYEKRFLDGVQDAEAAIVQTIQNALVTASPSS